MGDRRNRKSSWDLEKETKQLPGMTERNSWAGKDRHSRHGRHDEFYGSGTTATPNSRDQWSSRDIIEEHPVAPMGRNIKNRLDPPEGRDMDRGNRYYRNESPGFEGIERRNYNHPLENDRSYSHRYPGRGRSRSHSRSRSRSGSLNRGREMGRGSGWRSRSKSRSDGSETGRVRSRSPMGDYRRQSYGWNDRRAGPEKSSQVCRDFATGNCRRGNQCRFAHPDNTNRRDSDLIDDDKAGNWRQRVDHGPNARHSYNRDHGFELRSDTSDPYNNNRETEQFQSRSRNSIPCKDFVKGNCRWGDSCRFSHNLASDDGFDKGNRNASSAKPVCKYFATGKCDRDNCRFSHDDPNLETRIMDFTENISHEDPRPGVTGTRKSSFIENVSVRDKKTKWDGPSWDNTNTTTVDDTSKASGWSENAVTITNMISNEEDVKREGGDGWGHGLENKSWALPESTHNSSSREKQVPHWQAHKSANHVSHEDPEPVILETRKADFMENANLLDKGRRWDGQTWNDTPNVDDSVKAAGWGDTVVTNITSIEDNNTNRKGDDRWGNGSENKDWELPEFTFDSLNRGTQNSNMLNDGISNLSLPLPPPPLPPPHVHEQHHRITEFNPVNSYGPGAVGDVASRETTQPMLFSGQNLSRNGEGRFPIHSSNEFGPNLNGTQSLTVSPVYLQNSLQYQHKTSQHPDLPELNPSPYFANLPAREQSVQATNFTVDGRNVTSVTNTTVYPTQNVLNEQSKAYPAMEVSNMVTPSFPAMSENPPFINTVNAHPNPVTFPLDRFNRIGESRDDNSEHGNHNVTQVIEPNNPVQVENMTVPPVGIKSFDLDMKDPESPKVKQEELVANLEANGVNEENKGTQENEGLETLDGQGKVEESSASKDEKAMRLFKNALVDVVKEILKPKWKEGHMSREVHKTIVKKVVDKVTSTIQADHVPKTQDKIDLYLSNSKPKITKLIQAYVDRVPKKDSKKE